MKGQLAPEGSEHGIRVNSSPGLIWARQMHGSVKPLGRHASGRPGGWFPGVHTVRGRG